MRKFRLKDITGVKELVSTKILQKSLMLKRKLSKYLTAESLVACTCPLETLTGVILPFDPEKLVRVGRPYDLGTGIQTKTANGVAPEKKSRRVNQVKKVQAV